MTAKNKILGPDAIRRRLVDLEPAPAHEANSPPKIEEIYTPLGHEAALDPERPLVVGGRGVGKSFWTGALLNELTRSFIAVRYPRLRLNNCDVVLGFAGVDSKSGAPPSQDILDDLIVKDGFKPEVIWRAVVLSGLRPYCDDVLPNKWRGDDGLVAWADKDSERLQTVLRTADERLAKKGRRLVVVFDALDRLGDNWKDIRERSKALMRITLAFRSYKAIKPKIFMRIDQAEDQSLTSFPDASKLLGGKVDLAWDRKDLYGLLYSLLAFNSVSYETFEVIVRDKLGITFSRNDAVLPIELMTDEQKQESLFSELAGPYMGSDRRRGKTYSWIHNHLADAFGRVSPRSFLMALRAAAQLSGNLENRVIDPKALQGGLQVASKHRIDQLKEEFGWIQTALEPLADLRVPCPATSIFERWKVANTIGVIQMSSKNDEFLEPVEFSDSGDLSSSLLDAMRRIGVAERRSDGRINVPDIYRVAAKLLRKGGVRPE